MDRSRADYIGMIATVMNALYVGDCLESLGAEVRVQTAIAMNQIAEPYIRQRAIRHYLKNRIVIFACGTGNPFYSTDSAAVLRAADTCCDIVLKATLVDGVYDKDPHIYPDAKRYETLDISTVIEKDLKFFDPSAATMSRDNGIPILVFSLDDPENIYRAAMGEPVGTLITAAALVPDSSPPQKGN
jgi:uridylate kinase